MNKKFSTLLVATLLTSWAGTGYAQQDTPTGASACDAGSLTIGISTVLDDNEALNEDEYYFVQGGTGEDQLFLMLENPSSTASYQAKLVEQSELSSLAAIDNADFVVTDSFHGCVFSIIFKKKFVAIGNKERGLDRFISLLGRLGLQDRLVCSLEEFECRKDVLMTAPDYAAVDLKLDNWRKDSLDFLNKALS